mmetsp:Transcript_4052/g.7113  ORF Transcript_4052/g.7113 Transcript_4052/m.7113 type:complete len:211 (-) Transcript_4052:822-1454(-)
MQQQQRLKKGRKMHHDHHTTRRRPVRCCGDRRLGCCSRVAVVESSFILVVVDNHCAEFIHFMIHNNPCARGKQKSNSKTTFWQLMENGYFTPTAKSWTAIFILGELCHKICTLVDPEGHFLYFYVVFFFSMLLHVWRKKQSKTRSMEKKLQEVAPGRTCGRRRRCPLPIEFHLPISGPIPNRFGQTKKTTQLLCTLHGLWDMGFGALHVL